MVVRLSFLFFLVFCSGFSQEQYTISGSIYESDGQETLLGANVIFPNLGTGTISNEYGFYSITLAAGTYELNISYLGYKTIVKTIVLNQNLSQNFRLEATSDTLEEVVLKTDVERLNIKTPQMSINALNANTIKRIPVVFGEADVIKAISLLPGVSTGGEGTGGFNVRGGSTDQNLILLDERARHKLKPFLHAEIKYLKKNLFRNISKLLIPDALPL